MALATAYGRVRTRHNGLARVASGVDPFALIRRSPSLQAKVASAGVPTPSPPPNQNPVPPTPQSVSTSTGSPPGGATDGALPQYDLETDPVLQQVKAAAASGDATARASALKAREQALLQYGDPALAAAVLGASDPMAAAARTNPESTLALLKRGYTEGLHNFDNTLDPSLVYSGARIHGEHQLGQGYQDNLASAAANIQSRLGSIQDVLDAALGADADKVSNAYADAYNRALQQALSAPPAADPATLAALAALGG